MDSFSSYFLLKKPLKMDLFSVVSTVSTFSTGLVLGASDTGFTAVFAAVLGLVVDLDFDEVFADDFGFFVAIIPPLI